MSTSTASTEGEHRLRAPTALRLLHADDDARWEAVKRRDQSADGAFFYSVKTTGVYCRPSCAGRLPLRKNVGFHLSADEAERAGFRPCKRCQPHAAAVSIRDRVERLDWTGIAAELDAEGRAVITRLLTAEQCVSLAASYRTDELFRSKVIMARHGFGRGEYKYFAYPLPETVAALRTALYAKLATIANRWNEAMGITVRYPDQHAAYLKRCHGAEQSKPTPLLLKYEAGDYNCLHQDLYGELVFPLQVAVLLSRPGEDFSGGEFVLTEQRPRLQSRADVVPLRQGDAVVFPVHQRPVHGSRGHYRVTMRHGVSRLRAGHRHTLGIIFHDAR
jgi:uncharacterized protein